MTLTTDEACAVTDGIVERQEDGLTILSPAHRRPFRRVLFVNCYGGRAAWDRIKAGLYPPHHLWGCPELVRLGYEVALADPLPPEFYLHRNPLPHDLKLWKHAHAWLGKDGILYCGHNVLFWLPFLKCFGLLRARVVSLLYAREPLDFSRAHDGIVALNPAAADHARKLAPRSRVTTLAWGADLNFFPALDYRPETLFSCGRTYRDYETLNLAAARIRGRIRIISHGVRNGFAWAPNIEAQSGDPKDESISYEQLLHDYYARAAAVLIITGPDEEQKGACGFTNLIEAMAMARPVILTRTGAVASEIDIEKSGCGLFVPPKDPAALNEAMQFMLNDPSRAEEMGRKARELCEQRYNIQRYATELHEFFQTL